MLKMFGRLSIYKPINQNQYLNLPTQPTYPSSYLSLELEPSLKLAHPSKTLKAKAYPSPCYSCPLSVPTSP